MTFWQIDTLTRIKLTWFNFDNCKCHICQNCHIFQNLDEDNDDEETEDGGPPSRKSKSDSAGGFIPEKEDKSAVDDEEDGQVSLLLTRSFVKILFVI